MMLIQFVIFNDFSPCYEESVRVLDNYLGSMCNSCQCDLLSSVSLKKRKGFYLFVIYMSWVVLGIMFLVNCRIMEYMETGRKTTEKEVRELLKLYKWERMLSMENS